MQKRSYRLVHEEARRRAAKDCLEANDGWVVTVSEPTRSGEQNSMLWPMLQAFADQLQWPVNGKLEWLAPESWKDILTCAFEGEQARVCPGLDGGMVLLGQRTSQYGKAKFSEFIEFILATAAERDVDVHYMEHA